MFNPTPGKPDEPEGTPTATPPQEPASDADRSIPDEAYTYALECLLKGSKPSEVRRSLLDAGHSHRDADEIIRVAVQYRNESEANDQLQGERRSDGTRNMLIGGAVCLIGIAITLATLASAANRGSFVVAWGAILFGAIQFFRGMAQSRR